MKQPSDMTSYNHSSSTLGPRISQRHSDDLPSFDARADNALVLLRDHALDAARTAAAELRGNHTPAGRAVAVIETNTWSQVAAILEDVECSNSANDEPLSPEARLANSISLIHLDDETDLANLSYDFHYALVSLAKANLMMARLEVLKKQTAAIKILGPVEAELSALLDSLLDAIPEIHTVSFASDEQFAA